MLTQEETVAPKKFQERLVMLAPDRLAALEYLPIASAHLVLTSTE